MKLLPAHSTASLINAVHHTDIFDLCERVYRAGVLVDMILCDLPYGTTACAWDTVIPFEPMWEAFKRVIKPRGAIVLTASQPFTSALVMSNPKMFRYEWIWDKVRTTGFLDAMRKPLKRHENVLVFSDGAATYYPQMGIGEPYAAKHRGQADVYGKHTRMSAVNSGFRYPTSVYRCSISEDERGVHSTAKPVALFDYLIRTYTQVGDIVFDPTAGSGTTAVAARGCNRRYIVGDSSEKYVDVMRERLAQPFQLDLFAHTAQRETA